MSMDSSSKWPKVLPPLSRHQQIAGDEFMQRWHEILPRSRRYRRIEHFNHGFPVRYTTPGFATTIEIGAGLGEHLHYERLSAEQERGYCAVELRENMAEQLRLNHPGVDVIVGDCQVRLPFPDGHFDRYLAVHVLEHLPNLPACVSEAWRLLKKETGQLLVVIPCEGGFAYSLARRVSAQRIFERTYHMPYRPLIEREHLNRPHEISAELDSHFVVERRSYFPFAALPATAVNLCMGLSLRPRPVPLGF
jgi:SAM-dependent methyltransferase